MKNIWDSDKKSFLFNRKLWIFSIIRIGGIFSINFMNIFLMFLEVLFELKRAMAQITLERCIIAMCLKMCSHVTFISKRCFTNRTFKRPLPGMTTNVRFQKPWSRKWFFTILLWTEIIFTMCLSVHLKCRLRQIDFRTFWTFQRIWIRLWTMNLFVTVEIRFCCVRFFTITAGKFFFWLQEDIKIRIIWIKTKIFMTYVQGFMRIIVASTGGRNRTSLGTCFELNFNREFLSFVFDLLNLFTGSSSGLYCWKWCWRCWWQSNKQCCFLYNRIFWRRNILLICNVTQRLLSCGLYWSGNEFCSLFWWQMILEFRDLILIIIIVSRWLRFIFRLIFNVIIPVLSCLSNVPCFFLWSLGLRTKCLHWK